jgi:hypothetical protein
LKTTFVRLAASTTLILSTYSTAAIGQVQQSVFQISDVAKSTSSSTSSQPKNPLPAELKLQRELAEEALKLSLRQLELYKEISKLLGQGNPVPPEMHQEMDVLDIRQKEIADQQFSLSGQLFLKASEPGMFAVYIQECLNRINRALSEEDAELRRRFYGRTTWIQLYLTAAGKIESVIPRTSKQDKEFGDYLHDLIWKVATFPEVPQLKDRRIEKVSLSIPFTLQKAQP